MPLRIVFTSAKSRLMIPGMVMMSLMPCTAWRRMSSAMRKASKKLVPRSMVPIRRSLGMTITVSTQPTSSVSACSAWSMRRLPSKANGLVTTATESAPSSPASDATTGAAPLPVPPPRPAVMKIMSAPSSASMIFSVSSSAALRPISGLAPAPSPLVSLAPSCSLSGAAESSSACRSVLAAMNSTPSTLARIMRLTALVPPPPTPITLIRAPCSRSSLNEKRTPDSFGVILPPSLAGFAVGGISLPRKHLFDLLPPGNSLLSGRPPRACTVKQKSGGNGKVRLGKLLGEPGDPPRPSEAHRQAEEPFGQLRQAAQASGATGDDYPGGDAPVETRVFPLVVDQLVELSGARFKDLSQHARKDCARRAVAYAGNLDRRILADQLAESAGVLALDGLRLGDRRAQADGKIVGKMVAAHRHRGGVPHHSVGIDNHLGSPAADVEQAAAHLALIGGQAGLRRSVRLQHRPAHLHAGQVHRADDVLLRRGRGGGDVHVSLESLAQQSDWLADAVPAVEEKFLRENMQDHAVF